MATDTTTQQIVDVVTPSAGESVTEGTILEWHAKVGDEIKLDETIVEISTDKVDVELPAPATGTISEILVAEGDTVTVGQVIARISVGGAAPVEPDAPAEPSGNGAPTTDPPLSRAHPRTATAAPPRHLRSPTDAGAIVDVVTPAAGESVSEGTVLEWHAKVGDADQARRDDRRDLDRQGRHRASLPRNRDGDRAARRRGRHRHGRTGHRADRPGAGAPARRPRHGAADGTPPRRPPHPRRPRGRVSHPSRRGLPPPRASTWAPSREAAPRGGSPSPMSSRPRPATVRPTARASAPSRPAPSRCEAARQPWPATWTSPARSPPPPASAR